MDEGSGVKRPKNPYGHMPPWMRALAYEHDRAADEFGKSKAPEPAKPAAPIAKDGPTITDGEEIDF